MSESTSEERIEINSEADADRVLESLENSKQSAAISESPAQNQTPPPVDEYVFKVGGKEVKGTRDQVLKWAQMGYEAPNKIRQLSTEVESWKKKEAMIQDYEQRFGEVDKFVREKPEFWDHVIKTYQQKDQLFGQATNPEVEALKAQINELSQFKTQFEESQRNAQYSKEDQLLDQEIKSIQESYPQIDFKSPDENGQTLEDKVLMYAAENGIKKFTTAFRDMYHDELKKLYETTGKEAVVKDKQKQTKMGILGFSKESIKQQASTDHRNKNWGQLAEEAKRELGLI